MYALDFPNSVLKNIIRYLDSYIVKSLSTNSLYSEHKGKCLASILRLTTTRDIITRYIHNYTVKKKR